MNKDYLPIRHKIDPFVIRHYNEKSLSQIFTKQGTTFKSDCDIVHKGTFCRETAIKNFERISSQVLDCYKHLYKKYASEIFPVVVSHRCFILSHMMIIYELMIVFATDEITLDPLELFKARGGIPFLIFTGPNGVATNLSHWFSKYFIQISF